MKNENICMNIRPQMCHQFLLSPWPWPWQNKKHIYWTWGIRCKWSKTNSYWSDVKCQHAIDSSSYTPPAKFSGGILVSFVRQFVSLPFHLYDKSCPFCIFHNTSQIHFNLHILSTSIRSCVTCQVCVKIPKFFLIFFFTTSHIMFWPHLDGRCMRIFACLISFLVWK